MIMMKLVSFQNVPAGVSLFEGAYPNTDREKELQPTYRHPVTVLI